MISKTVLYYFMIASIVPALVLAERENNGNAQLDDEDVFIPTKEWQVIKEGQKIPKGLHIRINFETGLKEAKLMDVEDENGIAGNSNTGALIEQKDIFAFEEDRSDHIKNHNYRTYEQLKEELGEFAPKSDTELITGLLANYKNLSKTAEGGKYKELAILEDLDYLAHQYDNGQEFVRQEGFKKIILKNFNSSDTDILQATLKLLGSLTQNNVKVQIHALECRCVEAISHILQSNSDHAVKHRAVFALSSLLRRFPLAQIEFVRNGGLEIVTEQFDLQDTKLQLKLATFITDLLQEHEEALSDTKHPSFLERVKQYAQVDLKFRLASTNWCQSLNNLLFSVVIIDRYDHDSIEKTLTSMLQVADTCGGAVRDVVKGLEQQYAMLAQKENDSSDGYFGKMRKLCWDIINKISSSKLSDEL